VIVSKGTLDIKNDSKNSGRFHNHITKNQIKLHLVRQKLKVPGGCEHILNKRGHLDSGLVPHYPLRELSESIQYLHPPATNKEYSQYVNRRYSNPIEEFSSCIVFSILRIFTWGFWILKFGKTPPKIFLVIPKIFLVFPGTFFLNIPRLSFQRWVCSILNSQGRGVLLNHDLFKLLSLISTMTSTYRQSTTTSFPQAATDHNCHLPKSPVARNQPLYHYQL
jgi:hypothetical protein